MDNISRRRFVRMLAGMPFIGVAGSATTQRSSLGRNQVEGVELILRRLVDSGAVPGISYSIGNRNETLAEGAFGLRVVAPRTPMESVTRCPIASVSKQFVSAGAYLLQEKGALLLDTPLSEYVPDYVHANEMTLSQVLTMRSGIPADDEACETPVDGKINEESLIANLNKHKLDFLSGNHFAYSNCAYNLAGIVLARVSKMSYASFIEENFFKPLGMTASYQLGSRNESNFAHGYAKEAHGWKSKPVTPADKAFASGNLVSTPGDMQLWNRSLLNATLLSRESLQKMFTVPTFGGPAHTHYASGWFVEPSGVIWHAGTLIGYGTNNMLVPATGYAISLVSNTPQNDHWKPADVTIEMYNTASLGPKLPPLLKRVRNHRPTLRRALRRTAYLRVCEFRFTRHEAQRELHSRRLKSRLLIFLGTAIALFGATDYAASPDISAADTSALDFKQWGLVAIQDGGRRKPVDTLAKETLIRITGRSTYTDKTGRKWQPNDFVLSNLLQTHDWKNEPMVLVSFRKLKEQLGLDKTQRRFSFTQLAGSAELQRIANEAQALKRAEKPLDRIQQEALGVNDQLTLFARVMDGSALLIIPAPTNETDPWVEPSGWSKYYSEAQLSPVQTQLQTLATSYAQGEGFNFSRAANELRENLRGLSPSIYPQERQLRLEYFYNHFEAFYRAIWCYGIALVILIAAQLRKRGRALQNIGVTVALLGLAFQAAGIAMRCMIAGRPPVTNMYESIIWVSFAVSFFGMIFFARYRARVYLLAALPVTLIALLLVHQMPIAMPSSIDPLVPVLRDNFWLTVHVLTITLSYAAFALAMGFGHILLWRYARNPAAARADAPMHFWLYRVLQLGVLLLAAGTILGGVWANYSWGRFWGWDPKETWALIALLCYILALHGRLAGWWTQFGLAVASVVCFLAVLMAWYGVNFVLGKGLHSYGFGIGGETYVATFIVLDLLFVTFAIWRYRGSKSVRRAETISESETVAV